MTEKQSIDPENLRTQLDAIVDQLFIQASSREKVTEIITELYNEYGVAKPVIRKVATTLYKEATGKADDSDEEVKELLAIYR